MDSAVVGSYPLSVGYHSDYNVGYVDGYGDVDGYDDVGRRRRHPRAPAHAPAPGMARVPNLSPAQLHSLLQAKGLQAIPINPVQDAGHGFTNPTGYSLNATGQRKQPAAFTAAAGIAAGFPWQCIAQVQKGFQLNRLIVDAYLDATGAYAPGFITVDTINVGQRNQVISPGTLTPSIFSPNAFDCGLIFDPAGTGNFILVTGTVKAAAPGAVSISCTGIGGASL